MAWVSFCISTYKRPQLLHQQLDLLLAQTFTNFHIVISDNDPDASAKSICHSFDDDRIKYFHNGDNLGMIKSFNKSIERAETDYIVMVTDDDPIETDFLNDFHQVYTKQPTYSIYCGFIRKNKSADTIEFIQKDKFIQEIIDPQKTKKILWSSSIIKKEDALKIGKIPDYGSPHLADHAFLALVGSVNGGVVVNKMFSSLTSHNTNFSKSHFESYLLGCKGFHKTFSQLEAENKSQVLKAVSNHLKAWFIGSFFNLKRYYTVNKPNDILLKQVNEFALEILKLPFMKKFKPKFYTKLLVFNIKRTFGLLKA